MGEALGEGIGGDIMLGKGIRGKVPPAPPAPPGDMLGKGVRDEVPPGGAEYLIGTTARKITIAIPSKKPKIASLFLISISN